MLNPAEETGKKLSKSNEILALPRDAAPAEQTAPQQHNDAPFSLDDIAALLQDDSREEPVTPIQQNPVTPEQQQIETELNESKQKLLDVLQMTWPPHALSTATDIKILENTPYQLLLDTSTNHPYSLLIIANSQTNHESLDRQLDTLSYHLNMIYRADFLPEHDIDSFSNNTFGNYVTRIELNDVNLGTLLSKILPPESEIRIFLENYRRELALYNSTYHKEYNQILFDSLSSQNIIISKDQQHLLSALEQCSATIGFVVLDVNIADLGSKDALDQVRNKLMEFYITIDSKDFQRLSAARLTCLKIEKRLYHSNKLILRLNMNQPTDYNGYVKTFYLVELEKQYPLLKESTAIKQIDKNLRYANQLTSEHTTFCDEYLARYYQAKIKEKKAQDICVTLNMCRGYREDYAIHQHINTCYMQCKIDYLLNDSFRLSDLASQLNQLIENVIPKSFDSAGIIMEKMGFYAAGKYDVHYKAGIRVNPAWEYGLYVHPADQQLMAFYKRHLGKEMEGIEGFISISLANLALFYLLDFIKTAEKNAQYLKALQIAANLIKQYQLIVPSAYKQQLFISGHFSDVEKEDLEQRYKIKYQEEFNKAISYSRFLGWDSAFEQEVVICSSSLFKLTPVSESNVLTGSAEACVHESSCLVVPQ